MLVLDGICSSSGFRPYACPRRGVSKPCEEFDIADAGVDVDPKAEGGFEWTPKLRSDTFAVGVYELSWPATVDPDFISTGFRSSGRLNR